MSADRIDDLLADALETGEIPPSATPEERAELEPLLAAVASVRTAAEEIHAQASASLPTARARFQRSLEAERGPAVPDVPRPQTSPLRGGILGIPGRLVAAGWVAAVALVAITVVAAFQLTTSSQSAYAEELSEGDYLQVDGVVSDVSDDGNRIQIETPFGDLDIDIDDLTELVADDGGDLPAFVPGRAIRASGTVDGKKRLDAATISVSGNLLPNPEKERFLDFDVDTTLSDLQSQVLWFAGADDGSRGKAALRTNAGSHLLVDLDATALARLTALQAARPGDSVELIRDGRRLDFAPQETAEPGFPRECVPTDHRPRLPQLCGAVTAVEGGIATVETQGRSVHVEFSRRTRVVASPESGLDAETLRADPSAAEGHLIVVVGGRRSDRDPVQPDVIVVGPRR